MVVGELGKGKFAEVKEVKQRSGKKRFAWKQMNLEMLASASEIEVIIT